jgi:hypothetical protein
MPMRLDTSFCVSFQAIRTSTKAFTIRSTSEVFCHTAAIEWRIKRIRTVEEHGSKLRQPAIGLARRVASPASQSVLEFHLAWCGFHATGHLVVRLPVRPACRAEPCASVAPASAASACCASIPTDRRNIGPSCLEISFRESFYSCLPGHDLDNTVCGLPACPVKVLPDFG